MRTYSSGAEKLNAAIAGAVAAFTPPEDITVTQWADKKRRLSPESSAEPGPWRTSRTPYLKEPMDAFTDPKVKLLVMVASSQVGKSEFELNSIGYIIDQDPSSILYIHPTIDDAKKFSKLRVAPMVRDCKALRAKVADPKSRESGNTILQKCFPGGMLTMCGSNSASALASTPVRYVVGDELDRWAASAGTEGNPWELAKARQTTFYNAKSVAVSTPTIKGHSAIEDLFLEGTQERWHHRCPECGEFHNIVFSDIKFEYETTIIKNKKTYTVTSVLWKCPSCETTHTERQMKAQPAKWIAANPAAYANGARSFWLNAFSSPWASWASLILSYLNALGSTEKLQVVYNTKFGELWEDRGDLEDEETIMGRRETYEAELPDGVLVLTCGVDTQDDRLEYEVVGHGRWGEKWGIKRGTGIFLGFMQVWVFRPVPSGPSSGGLFQAAGCSDFAGSGVAVSALPCAALVPPFFPVDFFPLASPPAGLSWAASFFGLGASASPVSMASISSSFLTIRRFLPRAERSFCNSASLPVMVLSSTSKDTILSASVMV